MLTSISGNYVVKVSSYQYEALHKIYLLSVHISNLLDQLWKHLRKFYLVIYIFTCSESIY